MGESPEHAFLKDTFLDVLDAFSNLELYGFKETQRRRFDFSCLITRDWSRPLAGQAVWRHEHGIEKDLRTLVTDTESEIKAYVVPKTMKHRALLEEVISDYRRSELGRDLFRLKVFWIPDGFDADDEQQRALLSSDLERDVVEDLLFNVIFGRLSAQDVSFFLATTGILGLPLVLLVYIAEHTIGNIAEPASALGVSAGPIRERLLMLQGAGFVGDPRGNAGGVFNSITPRGRVFLELLREVSTAIRERQLSRELEYVLTKLGCPPVTDWHPDFPVPPYVTLVEMLRAARATWGIDLARVQYADVKPFDRPPVPVPPNADFSTPEYQEWMQVVMRRRPLREVNLVVPLLDIHPRYGFPALARFAAGLEHDKDRHELDATGLAEVLGWMKHIGEKKAARVLEVAGLAADTRFGDLSPDATARFVRALEVLAETIAPALAR